MKLTKKQEQFIIKLAEYARDNISEGAWDLSHGHCGMIFTGEPKPRQESWTDKEYYEAQDRAYYEGIMDAIKEMVMQVEMAFEEEDLLDDIYNDVMKSE